jgi:hypothetical protein
MERYFYKLKIWKPLWHYCLTWKYTLFFVKYGHIIMNCGMKIAMTFVICLESHECLYMIGHFVIFLKSHRNSSFSFVLATSPHKKTMPFFWHYLHILWSCINEMKIAGTSFKTLYGSSIDSCLGALNVFFGDFGNNISQYSCSSNLNFFI